jgi:CHRD domain-containing protein
MRRGVMFGIAAIFAGACSSDSARSPTRPQELSLPLVTESAQHAGTPHNHSVHLSGDEEPLPLPPAPTPGDSNAQGQAIFHIADDGLSFDYKLIASNIENIVQAHIHCGPSGVNGPIVVWLFPSPTAVAPLTGPTGRHDGVLVQGTVESGGPNHVRPAADSATCPGGVATFADVLRQLRSGNAYVNVHTNDGVAPTNTGPGDFPGGEIRGQFDDRGQP